jgi:pilus assembly protein Flp/PilA
MKARVPSRNYNFKLLFFRKPAAFGMRHAYRRPIARRDIALGLKAVPGPASHLAETKRRAIHLRLSAFFDPILSHSQQSFIHGTRTELPGWLLPGGSILQDLFKRFFADQSGATAIEYALIAAGISLAIIAAVNGIGSTLNTSFTAVNTSLK